jgi:peptidoglycan-associated lipoprotein
MKLSTIKSLLLLLVVSTLVACGSTSVTDDGYKKSEIEKDPPTNSSTTKAKNKGFDPLVYFDFDKSVIKSSEAGKIAGQAEKIKKEAPKSVTVEGHADDTGTKAYNVALGERRANSTKKALIKSGVKEDLIEVKSFGHERLLYSRDHEEYDKNRRTVTILNK